MAQTNQKNSPYPAFSTVFLVVLAAIMLNVFLKYAGGLGQNNSAEKAINEYAAENGFQRSDYPDEIVHLLKINDETKEFVLSYPSKIVNFRPDVIDFSQYQGCTEPPLLMQWDIRWGYMSYDGGVMGLKGSAPTALSMAAIYVRQDVTLTPVHMAEMASNVNWESKPQKLLSDGARSLGMAVEELPRNDSTIRQAVSEPGCSVVCLTDSKMFSPAIVIRGIDEEGKFLINDTLSKSRSEQSYSFEDFGSHLKKVWKYGNASSKE